MKTTHLRFDALSGWLKYHNEKDIRTVRKVYSIGDLHYISEYDRFSSDMSKPQFEKLKRHLPSSSNLSLNNNTILTSTLGKLLVRKLTHRSTTDVTKRTNDNYQRSDCSLVDNNMILKENLQIIERIGEGNLGIVFKALYRRKQNELLSVAVKNLHPEFTYNDIFREVHILREIQHPHIVHFFGLVSHTDHSMMFVMEYAHCKSLDECLRASDAKSEYSMKILLDFCKQIASAMSYLEKKFLIHRNLTCRNFLVFNKSSIKLSDLGLGHLNTSWKDQTKLPIGWMSPEAIHFHRFTSASDVFSFGISIWNVLLMETYHGKIICAIDAPNHQRLPRPSHATSELYQIMLHCWKSEPCERPTFSELEKTLEEIELKQVRWKNSSNISTNLPNDFLSIDSCLLGPLTVLDRCLDIAILPSSINNCIQCVAVNGQIGFVYNKDVEPLHVISFPKQTINSTSSTMNQIFSRKTGIKKNSTKTKGKHISKDMISSPQADFIHSFHIGVTDKTYGNMVCLNNIEEVQVKTEPDLEQSTITLTEEQTNEGQCSSLLDEVMQAFTEIYSEAEPISLSDGYLPIRSMSRQSPVVNFQSTPVHTAQLPSDEMIDTNNRSPPFSRLLSKLTIKKPNETPCRFSRELEERSRNGDLSEQGKHAYNLLINRCTSNSTSPSSTPDDHSFSSSFNQEKSDYQSHYSSISSLNSSINKNEQHSVTGQPLPPPPDLSSLGSKLTTATMPNTFKLPTSLTSNKYQPKRRFNLFA